MARAKKIKGRKGWFIDYHDANGKRIIRKGGDTRAEAKHALGQIITRVERQRHAKRHGAGVQRLAEEVCLADICKGYLRCAKAAHMDKPRTWRDYEHDLRNVLSFLAEQGVTRVSQLTPAVIEEFETVRLTEPREITYRHYGKKRTRLTGPVGQRTVNKVVGVLKAALAWAVEKGMIFANPIATVRRKPVKRKRKVRRALTMREKVELLEASPEPFRNMWALVLGTGLRRSELVGLRWSDIDLERGQLTVRAELAKNSEAATIPLREDLWEMLSDLHEKATDKTHVFVNYLGRPWQHGLLKRFYRCLDAAGIKRTTAEGDADIHSLRVTFATDLVKAGIDPKTAQRLLRHRSVEVTLRFYARVCQESLRPAIEAVSLPALRPPVVRADSLEGGNNLEASRREIGTPRREGPIVNSVPAKA